MFAFLPLSEPSPSSALQTPLSNTNYQIQDDNVTSDDTMQTGSPASSAVVVVHVDADLVFPIVDTRSRNIGVHEQRMGELFCTTSTNNDNDSINNDANKVSPVVLSQEENGNQVDDDDDDEDDMVSMDGEDRYEVEELEQSDDEEEDDEEFLEACRRVHIVQPLIEDDDEEEVRRAVRCGAVRPVLWCSICKSVGDERGIGHNIRSHSRHAPLLVEIVSVPVLVVDVVVEEAVQTEPVTIKATIEVNRPSLGLSSVSTSMETVAKEGRRSLSAMECKTSSLMMVEHNVVVMMGRRPRLARQCKTSLPIVEYAVIGVTGTGRRSRTVTPRLRCSTLPVIDPDYGCRTRSSTLTCR
jgi:hypothetical protein